MCSVVWPSASRDRGEVRARHYPPEHELRIDEHRRLRKAVRPLALSLFVLNDVLDVDRLRVLVAKERDEVRVEYALELEPQLPDVSHVAQRTRYHREA